MGEVIPERGNRRGLWESSAVSPAGLRPRRATEGRRATSELGRELAFAFTGALAAARAFALEDGVVEAEAEDEPNDRQRGHREEGVAERLDHEGDRGGAAGDR